MMHFDMCQNKLECGHQENMLKYKYVFPEIHPETSYYSNKNKWLLSCFSWLHNGMQLVFFFFFELVVGLFKRVLLIYKIVIRVQILMI